MRSRSRSRAAGSSFTIKHDDGRVHACTDAHDMQISSTFGARRIMLVEEPEKLFKTRCKPGIGNVAAGILIACVTILGNDRAFGTGVGTSVFVQIFSYIPLVIVIVFATLVRRKTLDKDDVLPYHVPGLLYACLLAAYLLILVQRQIGRSTTGCFGPDEISNSQRIRIEDVSEACLVSCPWNTTYRFQYGGAENRTLTRPQYMCTIRSQASGAILVVLVLVMVARVACCWVDKESVKNADYAVRARFNALAAKWKLVGTMLHGHRIQIDALIAPQQDPRWSEYCVGAAMGLAASSTILIDMVINCLQPISAANIVYGIFNLLSNMCCGCVIYVMWFWRPYQVYKRVFATQVVLDEFLTGSNTNVLCPLHVMPGGKRFLMADPEQLKAWMVCRQFLLDMLPAVYDAVAQSTAMVFVGAIVTYTWSIAILMTFYFGMGGDLRLSPLQTLAHNPGKVSEMVATSLVLTIWCVHLVFVLSGISKAQLHHADALQKGLLSLRLQPEDVEDLPTINHQKMIAAMVEQIRKRDQYPRVLSGGVGCSVGPKMLYATLGYFTTGLSTVLVTQSVSASSVLESQDTEQAYSTNPMLPLFTIAATTGIYLAAHALNTLCAPDTKLVLLDEDVEVRNENMVEPGTTTTKWKMNPVEDSSETAAAVATTATPATLSAQEVELTKRTQHIHNLAQQNVKAEM